MDTSIQTFVDNYSTKDFDKIKFDWNGKHGDEFIDNNLQFRKEILELIISQINTVNIDLIQNLYIELSKLAKEAWGIPKYFNVLAQELLLRDYKNYLMVYLEGASKSMDTYLDSGRINIPNELAENIVEFITELLEQEKDDDKIKLLNIGLERFKWLSQKEN